MEMNQGNNLKFNNKSKRRFILFVTFFLLSATALEAQYTTWVINSTRASNSDILVFMTEENLETALEIAEALGERSDPFIAEIIGYYFDNYWHTDAYKAELILFALFHSLFRESLATGVKKSRFTANGEILMKLLADVRQFESPELKSELFRLIVIADETNLYPQIAEEGFALVEIMKNNNGMLSQNKTEEILVILDAIQALGLADIKVLCLDVSRFSNNKLIVTRARQIAAQL